METESVSAATMRMRPPQADCSSPVGGGVLVLGIAWLSVGYQALRAARVNPVEALRTE